MFKSTVINGVAVIGTASPFTGGSRGNSADRIFILRLTHNTFLLFEFDLISYFISPSSSIPFNSIN